ncbi:MAG: phosphate ABC transporter permease PstA [Coriobacteriia bacterium]
MAALTRVRRARAVEAVAKVVTGAAAFGVLATAAAVFGTIVWRGFPALSWAFLTQAPRMGMREGGILPAIEGTLALVVGTALVALPLGIGAGVYLSEYAPRGVATRVVRLAITNMAGVPSIVYGLFGLAVFVLRLGLGVSVAAGALTLACLTLPVVITATEEALRQVPQELRQAALALGATRWRTTYGVVLPAAAPGIVTGAVLGLSRAAGETAPILFTAAAFFTPAPTSPLSKVMALPYHLYVLATQVPNPPQEIVWGTALVLVASVAIVDIAAAAWRSAARRRTRW